MRGFDFDANPAVVHTLATTSDQVEKGMVLCLIGDSGAGKSHLLIALGTEAAMAGYRVKSSPSATGVLRRDRLQSSESFAGWTKPPPTPGSPGPDLSAKLMTVHSPVAVSTVEENLRP